MSVEWYAPSSVTDSNEQWMNGGVTPCWHLRPSSGWEPWPHRLHTNNDGSKEKET